MKNKNDNLRQRNSSIELLKVIAIFIIVLSHAMPFSGYIEGEHIINVNTATSDTQYFLLIIFRNLGQIGNDIFLVCSSWYLFDSVSCNKKKMFYMIGDSFCISIIGLIAFVLLGYDLTTKYLITQLFPVTFRNNWYITCYLLFYIIHPFLNKIVHGIDKRSMLKICISLFVLCGGIRLVLGEGYLYFTELVGFVFVYFVIAYIKKYMNKTTSSWKNNLLMFGIGIVGTIGCTLFINVLGLKFPFFTHRVLNLTVFTNPFFILVAVGLFYLVHNVSFSNKFINYMSSLSLLIYIIHGNSTIEKYYKFDYFAYVYEKFSYEYLILIVFITAIIWSVCSIILSIIYRHSIQKVVKWLCDKVYNIITKIYLKIENILLKIE